MSELIETDWRDTPEGQRAVEALAATCLAMRQRHMDRWCANSLTPHPDDETQ